MLLKKIQRDLISEAIRSTVDEVVQEHYPALTQEHHLTPRIGERLEQRLNGRFFYGAGLSVITQDFPDKGRGALEKKVGSDIYIGISLRGQFNKGLLVQSKWIDSDDPKLTEQCERMLRYSPSAYVWLYGSNGVRMLKAKSVVEHHRYRRGQATWSDNLSNIFKEVLSCRQGDRSIGVETGPGWRERVSEMLQQLQMTTAVAIDIDPNASEA